MRRKDSAMSKEFAMNIIDKARYGVLSMIDENKPYGVPLSIVRDGDILYFHSAMDGRKVQTLEKNSRVSVAFIGEVKIPENFTKDKLDEIAKDSSKAAQLISSVFTTEFESAIVTGDVILVQGKKEKIKAMKLICEKYTPSKMEYFDVAINAGISRTNVFRINIEDITAKRKKYNLDGKEFK